MKYRKKPVVIEAYQTDKEMIIHTLEGDMKTNIGDYIITGINGEQYPCKPDIFEATYDRVEEDLPFLPNFEVELVKEEIANIASLLDNDPRMKKVEFDSAACSLHFVVQYSGNAAVNGIKEAAFTIYEGTTIVREDGIYRTEHRNG